MSDWIKERIDSEYKKHSKHQDWSRLASIKIRIELQDRIIKKFLSLLEDDGVEKNEP